MLCELGYDATSIPEGLAVVYGELESSNYTGIGVSCGGGLCNICLSYLSVPVFSFSIPKARRLYRFERGQLASRTSHAHPRHQRGVVPL